MYAQSVDTKYEIKSVLLCRMQSQKAMLGITYLKLKPGLTVSNHFLEHMGCPTAHTAGYVCAMEAERPA